VIDPAAALPARPLLKPWYRLAHDDGRLVLAHGESVVSMEGRAAVSLLPPLLPLLDGARTVDEIAGALGPGTAPAVENALDLLARRGLLCEGPRLGEAPRDLSATLLAATAAAPLSPSAAAATAAAARVAVVGDGSIGDLAASLLAESGVGSTVRGTLPWDGDEDLVLVTPGAGEAEALAAWNRTALVRDVTWLLVAPFDGSIATVGPLFRPLETCCLECFERRRVANAPWGGERGALRRALPARLSSPALDALLAGLAALVALRWLVQRDPALPGHVLALELGERVRLDGHMVLRVPRCAACRGDRPAPLPWCEAAL